MPVYVTNPSSKYKEALTRYNIRSTFLSASHLVPIDKKTRQPDEKDTILKKDLLRIASTNPEKLIKLFHEERKARIKAEELSEIDDITELLLNKRGWKKYVVHEAYKLAKANLPFVILFIDLDRLKAVDDTFTNQHGTVYIQLFAEVLYSTLRPEDIKSHPQGDEYFVMLPNTTLKEAKALRREIVENFEKLVNNLPPEHFFYEVPQKCDVGASIGIAYRAWGEKEREEILNSNWNDVEKKVGVIVRDTRICANADSVKIKKKKKVIRGEARRRSRIRAITQKFQMLKMVLS